MAGTATDGATASSNIASMKTAIASRSQRSGPRRSIQPGSSAPAAVPPPWQAAASITSGALTANDVAIVGAMALSANVSDPMTARQAASVQMPRVG